MKALFQFASRALALLALTAPLQAQLDLPDAPKPRPKDPGVDLPRAPRGDVAPGNTSGQRGGLELPGTTGPGEGGTVEAPEGGAPARPRSPGRCGRLSQV